MVNKCNISSRSIIRGDNIDALRELNSECIDFVYLDPPFKSDLALSRSPSPDTRPAGPGGSRTPGDRGSNWIGEVELRASSPYDLITGANIAHGEGMTYYLAFMSVRLLELRRVLKPTGSIYLHCSPRDSHYLKVLMDSIFGEENFLSEIIWKRTGSHGGARRWGPIHDVILFYKGRGRHRWNKTFQAYTSDYLDKYYKYEDLRGRYQLVSLTGAGAKDSESGRPWRGVDPTSVGRHWSVPSSALGIAYPHRNDLDELPTREKLELLDAAGLVHWPIRGRVPRQKRYLDESEGAPAQDVILDIPSLGVRSKERTGLPNQKPVKLLERLISASSDPGDLILDPFCGSGTTCEAAERLGRDWIGIEIDAQTVEIAHERLFRPTSSRSKPILTPASSDRPGGGSRSRSSVSKSRGSGLIGYQLTLEDLDEQLQKADYEALSDEAVLESTRELLHQRQLGRCNGCEYELPLHVMVINHVRPRSRIDPDSTDDLQLLCRTCAAIRGNRSMDYLKLELYKLNIIVN